jgi:hypothetical protein
MPLHAVAVTTEGEIQLSVLGLEGTLPEWGGRLAAPLGVLPAFYGPLLSVQTRSTR